MKKSIYKVLILLVLLSIFTVACSSDTKEKKSRTIKAQRDNSKDSDKISGSDSSDTSDASDDNSNGKRKTNATMNSEIQTFKDDVAKSCVETKTVYDKFKVAGDTDDGWEEVSDAGDHMITIFYGTDEFHFDQWPIGEQEYDDDGLYRQEIYPLIEKLGAISLKMFEVFADSEHDVNDIHILVKEYEDTVTNSGYATCNITK
jgi:hypothetical protein